MLSEPPRLYVSLREREQSRQILIVDDEEETAEAISLLLETAGFTTATVDAGLAALKELQESTPIVLLSPTLPDMDSVDLMCRCAKTFIHANHRRQCRPG